MMIAPGDPRDRRSRDHDERTYSTADRPYGTLITVTLRRDDGTMLRIPKGTRDDAKAKAAAQNLKSHERTRHTSLHMEASSCLSRNAAKCAATSIGTLMRSKVGG
jgi:hypothetical protein